MSKDLCTVTGCYNYGRYCRLHLSGGLKTAKPINPRSKKLEKVMSKEYRPKVKEMVEQNTPCTVLSPVCTGKAQGYHHPKGRLGENLLTEKIPSCNPCNTWLESNTAWGKQQGVIKSRHANYKRKPKI